MYTICLHPQAKEEFETMSVDEVSLIDKRLHMLRQGHWKNGTRVKKLRAVQKQINLFEARIDKGNRMLFTLFYDVELDETVVLVFRLSLHHDDVIRTARTILDDDIDFVLYEKEELIAGESFREFADSQAPLWKADYVFQQFQQLKAYEIDDETLTRFLMKQEEDAGEFWEMKLRLTGEQRALLTKPLPLLISGTAGSGKTTILIHKMLESPAVRKLYITSTKQLRDEAEKQFVSLVKGLDEEEEYRRQTTFLTFKDFMKEHMSERFQTIATKEHFIRYYKNIARGRRIEKDFPALMVWEEIRGIIKGGTFHSTNAYLTKDEYLALSGNEAPNFYKKREQLYSLFLSYEQYLAQHFLIDEQDLLAQLLQGELPSYELVLCDEIQDLTMRHLTLLFQLAQNDPSRLVLSGDDHQVVHHSGFRWENVKNAFYDAFGERVADIHSLSKNFRNTGRIAALAREINLLQKNYTDFKYKTDQAVPFHFGEMPKLLKGMEESALLPLLRHFGPYDAVLVRSEEEKSDFLKKMEKRSQSIPLLFTINEAKGLEFRRVLLWKVIHEQLEEYKQWKKIANIIRRDELFHFEGNAVMQRFIRYEASLLYVAVTRGMKECLIYDGVTASDVWEMERVKKQLNVQTTIEEIDVQGETVFSVEDWKEQGDIFFKRGLYEQAANCYVRLPSNAAVEQRLLVCRAHLIKQQADYEQAGILFEQAKLYDEAIECYEVAKKYTSILRICRQMERSGNPKWVEWRNEYKIKEFDDRKHWNGSAVYCMRQGYYKEALIRFERSEDDNFEAVNHLYYTALHNPDIEVDELKYIGRFFAESKKYKDVHKTKQIRERLTWLRDVAYVKELLNRIKPDYNGGDEKILVNLFRVNTPLNELASLFSKEDPHVQYVFALMGEKNGLSTAAIKAMLERAAEKGHGEAQCWLAYLLEDEGDMELALRYYKEAAVCQNGSAAFSLGSYYMSINNVKDGMHWMNVALELQYEDAYSDFAVYLQRGDVIPQDVERAQKMKKQYEKAVDYRKEQERKLKHQLEQRKKELDAQYSF